MKRLIYGVALIGIASIGFSFINNKDTTKEKDQDVCVTIYLNGKKWRETIRAFNSLEAMDIAKAKYPGCTCTYRYGACK